MTEIVIKDIEDLKQKRQQIIELQKRVEELNEVKLLKLNKQQELELNNKINELSNFDSRLIGDIIAKLMTEFEGVLYQCVKNNSWFGQYDYSIEPKVNDNGFPPIYSNYKLKKINNKGNIYNYQENKSLTFLPPSSFMSDYELNKESEEIGDSYIQYFIDFLYKKRSKALIYKITNEYLEIILKEFLLITKDLQEQRKEEITRKLEEKLQYEKRLEFEKSCLIDRKLIYNSLTYIINNYEDNILATQEYVEDWSRSSQWSELYGYHNLTIQKGENTVCFETVVDQKGCYPDEEYCGVYVNLNKDTNICFFDLKKSVLPIIKNCVYVEIFLNMVENLYNENNNIVVEDIQQIMAIISNERKSKKRILKKI